MHVWKYAYEKQLKLCLTTKVLVQCSNTFVSTFTDKNIFYPANELKTLFYKKLCKSILKITKPLFKNQPKFL